MTLKSYRMLTGSTLALLVLGASTSALADEAKKQQLKLAKCAASYKAALTACENVELAAACYQKADDDDTACRKAAGAVGHSEVEPALITKRREILARPTLAIPKKPLNCGGPFGSICADGHARAPICTETSQQLAQAGQGIGNNGFSGILQDANGGAADACTGQAMRCPAGFPHLVARKGQDLCWDSVENKNKYLY